MAIQGSVSSGVPILTVVVTGADAQVLAANNNRKGLIFNNAHATIDTVITPQPLTGTVTATAVSGIRLPAGVTLQIDTVLCTCAWRAFSAGGNLTILEWQ